MAQPMVPIVGEFGYQKGKGDGKNTRRDVEKPKRGHPTEHQILPGEGKRFQQVVANQYPEIAQAFFQVEHCFLFGI
jgi:hypothetical protein